jgi:hypothetical protein
MLSFDLLIRAQDLGTDGTTAQVDGRTFGAEDEKDEPKEA